MQQPRKIQKYLLDIASIVDELERIIKHHKSDYNDFQQNFISVRAVERDLMIIGEATNKIIQLDPNIQIPGARQKLSKIKREKFTSILKISP